jgi:hypothetical protein
MTATTESAPSIEGRNRAAERQLPKSTLDAIDWVLSLKDEQRLRSFLKGRSEEELQKIERYFVWKHGHGNN